MAIDAGEIGYAVAAAILVAFASWLLYLSPRQRATRALAILLGGMAFAWSSPLLTEMLPLAAQLAIIRISPGVLTTIGLATIYFLCVYPRPRGWIGRSKRGGWTLAAAGLVVTVAFAMAPELWATPVVVDGEVDHFDEGPFTLINNIWTITAGLLLVVLAIEHTKSPAGPVRRALTLIIAGFMASALVWQSSLVVNDLGRRLALEAITPAIVRVGYLIEEVALLAVLAAPLILLVAAFRSDERERRREGFGVALLALVALAAVGGVAALSPSPEPGEWLSDSQQVLDATGGVLIAAFAGYALLKHRLFDIDVKLRWTIRRGTVAAIFVGVFFVASQMAQNFLEDSMGWALGGVIAGVMLFAIAPIQRVADRVADVAMPGVRDGGISSEKRAECYRLALAMALTDRVITRTEERHLAALAEQLGISHTEALALREQVEAEAQPGAGVVRLIPSA